MSRLSYNQVVGLLLKIKKNDNDFNFLDIDQFNCKDEKLKNKIIKNISVFKDYKNDLLNDKILKKKMKKPLKNPINGKTIRLGNTKIFINKTKCEDYLKINNKISRWSKKYDKTYYVLFIYLLGLYSPQIVNLIKILFDFLIKIIF